MAAQANWYPDPADPENNVRYWDGSAWTNNVQPRNRQRPTTPAQQSQSAPQATPSAPTPPSASVNPFASISEPSASVQSVPAQPAQPAQPVYSQSSAPAYSAPSSAPARSVVEFDEDEGVPLVKASPLSALVSESREDRVAFAQEDAPSHHPAVGAFREDVLVENESPASDRSDARDDDDVDEEVESVPGAAVDPNFPYTVKEIKKLYKKKTINAAQYAELLRRADKRASNTRFFSGGGIAFSLYALMYVPVLAFFALGVTGVLVDPAKPFSIDAIIAALSNIDTFITITAAYAPFWWATVALIAGTSVLPGLVALFSLRKRKGRVWAVLTLMLVVVANPVVVIFGAATNGLLTIFGWV